MRDGKEHGHAPDDGHDEDGDEQDGRRQVEQQGPVEQQDAAEGHDAERARAAVLHDLEHALAAAAREEAVHRIHEAVAVEAARQQDGQDDEDGLGRVRWQAKEREAGERRQQVEAAEHGTDKWEEARAAAEVLGRQVFLFDEVDAREKLKGSDETSQFRSPLIPHALQERIDKDQEQDGCRVHHADGLHDVLGGRALDGLAHVGAERFLAEVRVDAAEADVQGTGHCRFGVAAVRARMLGRIAAHHAQSIAGVEAQEPGRDDEEHSRDARGDVVEHIVELGRRLAEVKVLLVLVADHRVHRVGRTVEHGKRHAAEHEEEERRDDAVDRVLRNRLDGRARDLRLVELRGIAADDPADSLARLVEFIRQEQRVDAAAGLREALRRDREGEQQRLDGHRAPLPRDAVREVDDARCHIVGDEEHEQYENGATEEFLLVAVLFAVVDALQERDELADQHDGMETRARVADDCIDDKGKDRNIHTRSSSLRSSAISAMMALSFSMSRARSTTSARCS